MFLRGHVGPQDGIHAGQMTLALRPEPFQHVAIDAQMGSGHESAFYVAIIADQHRIGESEPLYALRDLPNLFSGMRARVAIIRTQSCYGNIFKRGIGRT